MPKIYALTTNESNVIVLNLDRFSYLLKGSVGNEKGFYVGFDLGGETPTRYFINKIEADELLKALREEE